MAERLMLYHSTDRRALDQIREHGCLFGHEYTDASDGYSKGGNLVSDKHASQDFIRTYRGSGQWTDEVGPPVLVTLVFEVPQDLIKPAGRTHGFVCDEFAATPTIEARFIPDEYFDTWDGANIASTMTKKRAMEMEERGEIRFYFLPTEYLTDTEVVAYIWRGVHYPQRVM